MRIYETTFIINPQTDDASIDGSVKSITDIISNNGGKVLHEDRIGTRRLAYEIKGMTQGYYANIIFEGGNEILPLLKQHFKLGEAYLRNLTVQFEGSLEDLTRRRDHEDDSSSDDRGPRERRQPQRASSRQERDEDEASDSDSDEEDENDDTSSDSSDDDTDSDNDDEEL